MVGGGVGAKVDKVHRKDMDLLDKHLTVKKEHPRGEGMLL